MSILAHHFIRNPAQANLCPAKTPLRNEIQKGVTSLKKKKKSFVLFAPGKPECSFFDNCMTITQTYKLYRNF